MSVPFQFYYFQFTIQKHNNTIQQKQSSYNLTTNSPKDQIVIIKIIDNKPKPNMQDHKPQLMLKPPSPNSNSLPRATPSPLPIQSSHTKKILKLEAQNYNYRCQLEQLQETLTKLLTNNELNTKLKRSKTQLHTKLSIVKKQIENKNKHIDIKKTELRIQKSKEDAIRGYDSLAENRFEIEGRQRDLDKLRKQVRALAMANKGVEQKLLQYNLKGKQKLTDVYINMMHEILNENQRLKLKLVSYESTERKKEEWLEGKKRSASELKRKVSLLPEINSKKNLMEKRRSVGDLGKLSMEKDIYVKFLEVRKPRKQQKLTKEIKDAEIKEEEIRNKISLSELQIQRMQERIRELKQHATPDRIQKARHTIQKQEQTHLKLTNVMVNCDRRYRTQRRDWIGKFGGLRFSDSRVLREETRLCHIVYNDLGFYRFGYYLVSNQKNVVMTALPFDTSTFLSPGKQTAFRVEHPDYVKTLRMKISLLHNVITEVAVVSNLGLTAEFPSQVGLVSAKVSPQKRKGKTGEQNFGYVPPEQFTSYTFDVKPNEAPTLMFGSYLPKYDDKHHLVKVSLEGLGVQTIQDYIEEFV